MNPMIELINNQFNKEVDRGSLTSEGKQVEEVEPPKL